MFTNSDDTAALAKGALGPTTRKHFANGYRSAMADIAAIVDNTGEKPSETASYRLDQIRDWIENNSGILFY